MQGVANVEGCSTSLQDRLVAANLVAISLHIVPAGIGTSQLITRISHDTIRFLVIPLYFLWVCMSQTDFEWPFGVELVSLSTPY
jgi:hypothetical protein